MIPNLDIDLLKTFLAISDAGSFTRAAEEVNKTQSAVSMQMKRLEELLGRPLFARDGRASRFTPDGERLVEYARRLVSLNDEAVSTFRRPGNHRHRALRHARRLCRPLPARNHGALCPHAPPRHRRMSTATRRRPCSTARAAANSISRSSPSAATSPPMSRCRREPLVWVTSARHSTHLLEVLPLAVSHASCEWRGTVLRALEKAGRKHRIAYSSQNSNAVNAAVQSGLAVGAVPELCVRPGMRLLTEKDGFPPLGSFEIGLVRKPGRASSAVEALARHVTESLGSFNPVMMAAE